LSGNVCMAFSILQSSRESAFFKWLSLFPGEILTAIFHLHTSILNFAGTC
jgi:hypothetical protein